MSNFLQSAQSAYYCRLFALIICIALSQFITFQPAHAADPFYNSYRDKGAIRGHDPVAYFSLKPGAKAVKGKKEFSYEWEGVTWYFSSLKNLKAFKENPTAYAPQFGGYCSFAVSKNFTTSIRPDSWLIHEGKLYLNHNSASQRLFSKSIDNSLAEANNNWPTVLTRCERRNNCRGSAKSKSK